MATKITPKVGSEVFRSRKSITPKVKITPKVGSEFFRPIDRSKKPITPKVGSIQGNNVMTLFHQTSIENAKEICKSKTMKLGSNGICGAGIYFAEYAMDTFRKARNKGVILECRVDLGRIKEHKLGEELDKKRVKLLGYDSVVVKWTNGKEYVIYDPFRIKTIKILR